MKRITVAFYAVLMALMVLLPIQAGECYVTLKHKDVALDFGKFKLPEEMSVVEIDVNSFIKMLEEDKNFQRQLMLMSENEQYRQLAKYMEYLKRPEVADVVNSLKLYQGGLYDGKSYRTVWFFTMQENKYLNEAYGDFFKGKLTDEKMFQVTAAYGKLLDYANQFKLPAGETLDASQVKKFTSKNQFDRPRFEILEISQPQFVTIKGKQGIAMDYRVAGEMMGAYSGMYMKQYALAYKNKPAVLAFMSLDSERSFWQEIFDRSIIEPEKESKKG